MTLRDPVKTINSELTTDSFGNEDFDFGEDETRLNAFKTHVKPRYKKMLVLLAIGAVFIVAIVGYGVYRFWVEQPTNLGYDTDPSQADLPKEMAVPDEKPIAREVSGSTSAEKLQFNGTERASSEPEQSVRVQRSDQHTGSVQNPIKELFSLKDPDKTNDSNSEQPSAPTAFNLEPSAEPKTLELTQDLQNVTRQMSHVIEQVGYLEPCVSSLSEKLNTLTGSVSQLDSRLSDLTNTTTALAMNVVSLRADVAHFKKILRIDGVQRDVAQDSASDQQSVRTREKK